MFGAGWDEDKKLTEAKKLRDRAVMADSDWQALATTCFGFRDGEGQWTDAERTILKDEMRPCLTMNITKASCDLVMGLAEDARKRYFASPVEKTDEFLCEVVNNIDDWVTETSNFTAEEDAALESAVVCGRGWVAIDIDPDPKRPGEIAISEQYVPPHEVRIYPAASRSDLSDAPLFWDRWLAVEDFKIKYPKFANKAEDLMEKSGKGQFNVPMGADAVQSIFEEPDVAGSMSDDSGTALDSNYYDRTKNLILVSQMEYWQDYDRYYGWNPTSGVLEEFDKKDLPALKMAVKELTGGEFEYITAKDKKIKWFQFCGDMVLYDGDSPLPYDGFSLVPVFAFSDLSRRTMNHFGLVKLMMDPQKEVNKRWSQTLNLLNKQVQTGLYAETDAFVDHTQAEQSMKEAGSITYLQPGGLNKVKERGMPAFPHASMQLEEAARGMMRWITGINPDLLGIDSGRQEPGVVVRLRQQQGLIILKPIFRNYNHMRKELFKRRAAIIMAYMPDEQIMRIMGQNDRYQIQDGVLVDQQHGLMAEIRDIRNLKYNINAEEAPGNLSKKAFDLSMFIEMMAKGLSVPPEIIVDKMDLPSSDKAKWTEYITSQQQAAAEEAEKLYQLEIAKVQAKLGIDQTKAQSGAEIGAAKVGLQAQREQHRQGMDEARLSHEMKRTGLDFVARMAQTEAQRDSKRIPYERGGK